MDELDGSEIGDKSHLEAKKIPHNPLQLTPERKQDLERNIAAAAELFNKSGLAWFLAGSPALELKNNELQRDHRDVDIAMYKEDLVPFFDYAVDAGYSFERPMKEAELVQYKQLYGHDPEVLKVDNKRKTIWVKVQDARELSLGHNAFARAVHANVPLAVFEVIALQQDPNTGDILFEADPSITFPEKLYANAPKFIAINGQEVPLTPTVVQMMYKVYDGRYKDIEDIRRAFLSMSVEEKQQLNDFLQQAHIELQLLNGTVTANVLDALSAVSKITDSNAEQMQNDENAIWWQVNKKSSLPEM